MPPLVQAEYNTLSHQRLAQRPPVSDGSALSYVTALFGLADIHHFNRTRSFESS